MLKRRLGSNAGDANTGGRSVKVISVVCVYNNKTILEDCLLKSLRVQTTEYELILVDNTEGRF